MSIHIVFCKGLQASGKSTWSKQFVKDHQDYKRVNRDDLRHMLSSYQFDKPNEDLVTLYENYMIKTLIENGYNLVIDRMNLNAKSLEHDIKWVTMLCETYIAKHPEAESFNIEVKEFPITLAEALERDKNRPFPIGEKVIKDTYHKYEVECKQMIARAKPRNEDNENSSLPMCIICDIDGTLSDSTNRRIFDDSKVFSDEVIKPVHTLLLDYRVLNEYIKKDLKVDPKAYLGIPFEDLKTRIFIMSGRQDSCKEATANWLNAKGIPFDDIFMRKTGDFRDDREIKKELYEQHIKGKYRVLFVIDDRPKVCQMWIDNGLFVMNVNQDPYCKNDF